jgi:HlyD family secretion protein
VGLIAKLARLRAEQAGASEITFPPDFATANDPLTDNAIKAEQIFFAKRSAQKLSRIDVQQKLIDQYAEQAKASAIQMAAVEREIELYNEQRVAIASLVKQGFAQKSQLTEIDAKLSEYAATHGEYAGDRAKAEQAEAGARFSLAGVEIDMQSEIAGEITTALTDLADTEQRIVSAKDVMRRVEVLSPEAGIVDNIRLRTSGSVVRAGEPILDIVPQNEPLVIETKVNPRDIDDVSVNSPVKMHLTAYNQRSLLPLDGKVTYVAADQLIDDKTGNAYFVARAEIAPQSLAANPAVKLYPGMPADMVIVHKSRKALQYIVGPIWESFNHAFRED